MSYSRKNFLSHTQRETHRHTDRRFPEIVNLFSGHPKTCKSIKNWQSKIFMKPILSSIYVEESKNHHWFSKHLVLLKQNKKKILSVCLFQSYIAKIYYPMLHIHIY